MSSTRVPASGGGYENLFDCHDNEILFDDACEMRRKSGSWEQGTSNGRVGGTDKVRATLAALAAIATLAALGMSCWTIFCLHRNHAGGSSYATFVLDAGSMSSCGKVMHLEPPCLQSAGSGMSSSVYRSSIRYNSALGPWKLADCSVITADGVGQSGGPDGCGVRFSRRSTHLIVERSGLYELSAQVTFANETTARVAELVWQVNNVEWIAVSKAGKSGDGGGGGGGPTCVQLTAVRRLHSGQMVSLHTKHAPRAVAAEPSDTRVVVSML